MKTTVLATLSVASLLLLLSGCSKSSSTTPSGSNPTTPPTPTTPPVTTPPVLTHDAVINQELMITSLSVVNDARANGPDGPWSFGGLIKRMAGTTDPSRFLVNWLTTWDANQTINSFNVPSRTKIRDLVINPWKTKDGQAGVDDDAWTVNFANAPFRLLAIVNRMDLNRADGDTVQNAGEGRFVFGVLNATGGSEQFTVIFEYELLANDRASLRGWAQQWHALGAMTFGPQYNAALQVITDRFSGANKAPAKPNGSPLNQLRTNEIALVLPNFQLGWELREFHIVSGSLKEVSTRQSPDNTFQNSPALAKFINDNEPDILDRNFEVPVQFDGAPFLAGSSIIAPPARGFAWNAPGIGNPEARHIVAFTACNGCHHVETGTTDFLHVKPRAQNAEAGLSGFLTGIAQVPDPVNAALKHDFHDLDDRAVILKALATEEGTVRLQGLTQQRRARVH